MKSDTKSYIHLQTLYKHQAAEDRSKFKQILLGLEAGSAGAGGGSGSTVALEMLDDFVKNTHGLKLLRGKQWGVEDKEAIGTHWSCTLGRTSFNVLTL